MLTTEPGDDVKPHHDRQIVLLRPEGLGTLDLSDEARERVASYRPVRCRSREGGTDRFELVKREGTSTVARKVSATTGPTPGVVISRRQTSSWRTISSGWR
jgi:hypothetical protein